MNSQKERLLQHQKQLSQCQLCEDMQGPAVFGAASLSPVMLIGQAPGFKEIEVHKPFAWTAGKTLFNWFNRIEVEEERFRQNVYMSAMCRCFPGKLDNGKRLKTGDRVPTKSEIQNCSRWLNAEIEILRPKLIIPVGKLAITNFIKFSKLTEVIGQTHMVQIATHDLNCDLIPLPHPSGASTWPHTEPGKTLLDDALTLISQHSAWKSCFKNKIDT